MQGVICLITLTFRFPFTIASSSSIAFEFLNLIEIELLHINLLCSFLLTGCFFAKLLVDCWEVAFAG